VGYAVGRRRRARGRVVQVDPIKPPLKTPGIKRMNLNYNILLSGFGFKFNLRRYNVAAVVEVHPDVAAAGLVLTVRCDHPKAVPSHTVPVLATSFYGGACFI
jgi:hypothetical protein